MPKTTNLGLELTTDDSVKFKNWRKINGVGVVKTNQICK